MSKTIETIDLYKLTWQIGWENIEIEIDSITYTIPKNFDWVNNEWIHLISTDEHKTIKVSDLVELINIFDANLKINFDKFALLEVLNVKNL